MKTDKRFGHPVRILAQVAAASLALILSRGLIEGQNLPFDSGSTGADGALRFQIPARPPKRSNHAMAYDAARNEVVLFGGGTSGGGTLGDTWVWNGVTWIAKNLTSSPPGRASHAMAYDPVNRRVILFGGLGNGAFNDTWAWNGTNWTQLTPVVSPSPRVYQKMVFDAVRQKILLFGSAETNDTWYWTGANWEVQAPTRRPTPSTYAIAYDSNRGEVVLFGGVSERTDRGNDTWIWDGTDWTLRTPITAPSPRSLAVMTYDSMRRRIVMFGGVGTVGGNSVHLGDTWIWDGTNWQLELPQNSPPPRFYNGQNFVYDAARGRAVLFAGQDYSIGVRDDTWEWDGEEWLGRSNPQTFDTRTKSNGVWNFTTIEIPAGLAVNFTRNPWNNPVRWLASDNVSINGGLYLNGAAGNSRDPNWPLPYGGTGGFDGGSGGVPSFGGSPTSGTAGLGPGGGLPGVATREPGQAGRYASVYGNPFIVPLIGGSGGGGSGSSEGIPGNDGGGGGGAILISSSLDLSVGAGAQVLVNGGAGFNGSGSGSGGAIRLRADRIIIGASAAVQAVPDGRIRLESFERTIAGSISPGSFSNLVISAPVPEPTLNIPDNPLRITSVHGQNVTQPPGGSIQAPDVVFSAPGVIAVTVQGLGIPNGTPVRLRVTMDGSVLEKPAPGEPPALLAGETTTFTLSVPRGRGTLQAFAEFTLP